MADFAPSGGEFTVPRDGLYLIQGRYRAEDGSMENALLDTALAATPTNWIRREQATEAGGQPNPSVLSILRLEAGDRFRVSASGVVSSFVQTDFRSVLTAIWLAP